MHGDLGQAAREKALKAFRTSEVDVLVATDVAARGIDIDDITHVINYQIHEDEQAYVHRIGRTGRAGKTGIAVTLVDWDELPRWTMIDKALGLDTPDPADTYSNSPHFHEDMGIPTDATGKIGPARASRGPRTESRRSSADGDNTSAGRSSNRNRRRTRGGNTGGSHLEGRPEAPEQKTPATSNNTANTANTAKTDGTDGAPSDAERSGRRRRRRRPSKTAAAGPS